MSKRPTLPDPEPGIEYDVGGFTPFMVGFFIACLLVIIMLAVWSAQS